jgi:tungstate transport system substrate-binding protein
MLKAMLRKKYFGKPPLSNHVKEAQKMKSFLRVIFTSLVLLAFLSTGAFAVEHLKLSTTTSTENSGLLRYLLPAFEKQNNVKVDVIPVGTGKALQLAKDGDVDVTLVHARAKEDAFVESGYGINRRDVMYNDFVILGPPNDPANVKSAKTAAEAMKKIAEAKATFVSRADQSGTNFKEKELWKAAGIEPKGKWYVEAGRGMGDVLIMANEMNGYTLSDRGTYIAFEGKTDLQIVEEGDKALFNPYGVIAVNPKKYPHVNYDKAMDFIAFLTSNEGQKMIQDYKMKGKQLFFTYKEWPLPCEK